MGREQASNFGGPLTRAGDSRSASALASQVALLKGAVEASAGASGNRDAKITELQRKAIASLKECAEAVLKIADLLDDPKRAGDAISRYLRPDGARAPFPTEADVFFEYARNFVLHLPGPNRRCGFGKAPRAPRAALAPAASFRERLERLTPSQKRAFDLLVKGLPNKLIAYELGLAESTVKAHMSALFRKLGVHSRTHAIAMAANLERDRSSLGSEIAFRAPFSEGAPLPGTTPSSSRARTGSRQWPTR